jgi:hypothetical protein
MFLLFPLTPISKKYLRKFIFRIISLKILSKRRSNYNDKEFYYIGQSFKYDDKDYIAIASAKIIM